MKTLLFCTTWANSDDVWQYRYGKWLNHVLLGGVHFDQVLMVDDGSSILPKSFDMTRVDPANLPISQPESSVVFCTFSTHLGRSAIFNYPGWWRSFGFAAQYAARYGFNKVVHIESDSFVLSSNLATYLNQLDRGWTALWCPRWSFPETCIQVITEDCFAAYQSVMSRPYEEFVGQAAEHVLPFTQVERCFKGDRYGEYLSEIPQNADYATQTSLCSAVWFGSAPPLKKALSISLGVPSIPPHPFALPQDAWNHRSLAIAVAPDAWNGVLKDVIHEKQDAIQVVVPSHLADMPIDIASLVQYLSTDGVLLVNVRVNQAKLLFQKMQAQLQNLGFLGAAVGADGVNSAWFVSVYKPQHPNQTLVVDRLTQFWRALGLKQL